MKELLIQNQIRLNLPSNVRMFRNNVGLGWTGKSYRSKLGGIIIENPRPLHAGLCTGSSDLIGWTTIKITFDMIGTEIAVFTAIEVKTEKGKIKKEQINFIDQVKKSGGYASVIRSVDDLKKMFS